MKPACHTARPVLTVLESGFGVKCDNSLETMASCCKAEEVSNSETVTAISRDLSWTRLTAGWISVLRCATWVGKQWPV